MSAPSELPLEKASKENAHVKKNLRKGMTNMSKEGSLKQIRTTKVLGLPLCLATTQESRLYLTSKSLAHRSWKDIRKKAFKSWKNNSSLAIRSFEDLSTAEHLLIFSVKYDDDNFTNHWIPVSFSFLFSREWSLAAKLWTTWRFSSASSFMALLWWLLKSGRGSVLISFADMERLDPSSWEQVLKRWRCLKFYLCLRYESVLR